MTTKSKTDYDFTPYQFPLAKFSKICQINCLFLLWLEVTVWLMLVREALLLVNSDMQHDPETAIWEPQTDNEWQTTLDLWNMGSNTNGKNLMNQFFKTLIDFFFSWCLPSYIISFSKWTKMMSYTCSTVASSAMKFSKVPYFF